MNEQSHLDRGLDALREDLPPPAMSDALERELAGLEPVKTRRPVRQLVTIVALSLLYAGGLLALLGIRPDVARLPAPLLLGWVVVWLVSFVAITYLVVVPPPGQVMPRYRPAALIAALAGLVAVAGGLLLPAAPGTVRTAASAGTVLEQANPCLSYGMLTALVPAVLAALAIRGAVPVSSRWSAAAIGAASGALGGLVLHLHCSLAERLHLGLVHGGVVILAAVVTACVPGIGGISGRSKAG